MTWTPEGWRAHPISQQPNYADQSAVEAALSVVRAMPPLVSRGEVDTLSAHLAKAARGEAFLLQGGDCAERFEDCGRAAIVAKMKVLLQMSLVLTWGARMPIIRVGRMAGQYAKPRSKDTEIVDGVELPTYRGDHVNGFAATPESRRPDPERLVKAYFHSAATLNYARALIDGGFADLNRPGHWDLAFVRQSDVRARYQSVVDRILDSLAFVKATGVQSDGALRSVELYTSHEGLLLAYEEAQTAKMDDGRWYNQGAHMLWIGDRTRGIDGAHIEYFRGIANPIGMKVGPTLDAEGLVALLERLDPDRQAGRVTLITRLGALAPERLPILIAAVAEAGHQVVWSCDPMHGNTIKTQSGIKTRNVDTIRTELQVTFDAHRAVGRQLGGVHLELTGEDVTECVGGPQELSEADLSRSYETFCDPRLNYAQSLEVGFQLADWLAATP